MKETIQVNMNIPQKLLREVSKLLFEQTKRAYLKKYKGELFVIILRWKIECFIQQLKQIINPDRINKISLITQITYMLTGLH